MIRTTPTLLAAALALTALAPATEKPNILFIFADDQAYETVAALGYNDEVQTPHLDRLSKRSTVFSHAYNMGGWNGAICVASRTMLNTGLFIWDAQKSEQSLKSDWVPKNKFWAQQLAAQGYDTYFTGKWHVKADANKVFATARHIRGGMPRQTPEGYNRPKADGSDPWDPSDPKFGGFWEGGTHWSEVVGNDALDYLAAAAKDDDPFFMYLAFNAPHDPRQAPKEFVDRYPARQSRRPRNLHARIPLERAHAVRPQTPR